MLLWRSQLVSKAGASSTLLGTKDGALAMTLPNLFRPEDVERANQTRAYMSNGHVYMADVSDNYSALAYLNAGLPPALRALAEAAIEAHANRSSSGGIPRVFRREVWLAVENFARSLKGEAT